MAKDDITSPVTISVEDGFCKDGCGARPLGKGKNSKGFLPGHDARLKSLLHRAHRGGATVEINGRSQTAADVHRSFGWPMPAERKARKPMSEETKAKLRAAKGKASPKGSTAKASRVQPARKGVRKAKVGASA